ncbi:hypothetical protein LINPERHAP2_LOCUS17087 [Linum perenne]
MTSLCSIVTKSNVDADYKIPGEYHELPPIRGGSSSVAPYFLRETRAWRNKSLYRWWKGCSFKLGIYTMRICRSKDASSPRVWRIRLRMRHAVPIESMNFFTS